MIKAEKLSFAYREEDIEHNTVKEEIVLKELDVTIEKDPSRQYSDITAAANLRLPSILMSYSFQPAAGFMSMEWTRL